MNLQRQEIRSLIFFLGIGLFAFGVDYGVLWLGLLVGANPIAAKSCSWFAAVVTTFLLNSVFTFPQPRIVGGESRRPFRRRDRFFLYVATQAVGGAINVGTFLLLLPLLSPLLSLEVATHAATFTNYLGARSILGKPSTQNVPVPSLAKQRSGRNGG